MAEPPINVATLKKMKSNKEAIACITAYDASFSLLVDKAGIDVVLVGDSLGMVIQGHDTTVPVTVDDVVYHSNNVAKGLSPHYCYDRQRRLLSQGQSYHDLE